MNECFIERDKPSMPVETRRKLSASMMNRTFTEESKALMLKAAMNKKFPITCNRCSSRDAEMCVRNNMTCFTARETTCFRHYTKRVEHPDYVKKIVKQRGRR